MSALKSMRTYDEVELSLLNFDNKSILTHKQSSNCFLSINFEILGIEKNKASSVESEGVLLPT
jgi:hypothetical protein